MSRSSSSSQSMRMGSSRNNNGAPPNNVSFADTDTTEEAEFSSTPPPLGKRSKDEDIHKQGRFFEFVNPQTEARFTEYRFGSVGLRFYCILGLVWSMMLFSAPNLRFQADVLKSSPTEWLFNGATWQQDKYVATKLLYWVDAALVFSGTAFLFVYNKVVRKNAPIPGDHMARLILLMCISQTTCHCLFDYRYEVFCEPDKFSVLLRDDYVVSKCDDFVEPYVNTCYMNMFILLPRFKEVAILLAIFLPTPFYLRYPIGYDYLFRTSDAVWFFTVVLYLISFAMSEYTSRRQFIQHEIVQQEMKETKRAQNAVSRLLDAMLPASVLKRLIAKEKISDSGVVSVVFSDVAGFTPWCSSHTAQVVVSLLNTMYSLFDNGLLRYGIEKVKTIGDAYWAVCGLPDPNPNHVLHVCAFAKYMQRCVTRMRVENMNHLVHIRVGVHTGNVCGGLVGSHQSSYDMFGTTNEVAELMEQRAPVDGILISEMSYMQLRASELVPEEELIIELQDTGIDTCQGTISTFVLKRFGWEPSPPVIEGHDEEMVYQSSGTDDSYEADSAPVLQRKHRKRAAHVNLDELKAKMSAASLKLHHTFDDEEVEAEFQQFMRTVFPNKLKAVNSMLGGMIFLICTVLVAEGNHHPWYTLVLLVLDMIITTVVFFFADRVSHPLVGLGIFYAECNLLLFALFSANRSVVSVDLVYLSFSFAVFSPTLGYVGGNAPYLYICAANILFLLCPTLIIMVVMKSIFALHFHIPGIIAILWIIALGRSEVARREQFINKKLADVALEQTKKEHENVSEVLSHMVPRFIVEGLTLWVCGPRTTMIAAHFPLVGILFARVPSFQSQFSQNTVDPTAVMGLISKYANACDSVLDRYPDCTKLKIVGDVLLFASGISGESKAAVEVAVEGTFVADDVVSLCSDWSNNESESSREHAVLFDYHLLSMAHLATDLAAEVEERFEGATISAGMHCGPATGGVIGNDRLIYDVFGDTVNTAHRVMSTSGEGVWASVKFSTKLSNLGCRLLIGDRVERQMKGKGTMHVVPVNALPMF